jgi:hypothetical protein
MSISRRKLLFMAASVIAACAVIRPAATAEVRSAGHLLSLSSSGGIAAPGGAFRLVGGMGGGGGMGMGGGGGVGMGGGGFGGMMGGGMGAMGGGVPGYGAVPGGGADQPYGGGGSTGAAGTQPVQYFQCVTQYGQCPLASSLGSFRSGGACTCSNGHQGKIK